MKNFQICEGEAKTIQEALPSLKDKIDKFEQHIKFKVKMYENLYPDYIPKGLHIDFNKKKKNKKDTLYILHVKVNNDPST